MSRVINRIIVDVVTADRIDRNHVLVAVVDSLHASCLLGLRHLCGKAMGFLESAKRNMLMHLAFPGTTTAYAPCYATRYQSPAQGRPTCGWRPRRSGRA